MDTTMLFTVALQLADPWKVIDVSFRDAAGGKREPRITVGYGPGSRVHCPEAKCREGSCPVHDTAERTWRHLDFFQYRAYIHALVPRVACPAHGVRTVPMSWARPGSGFTLLFEAMVVELAETRPVAGVATQVGEHDTRLWRFIRHYVGEARLYEDCTDVEAIGIDGTGRKGHGHITVVADPAGRNVACVVPGKDSNTVKEFARDFMDRNGDPDRVSPVTCDMSPGFARGIRERLPHAHGIIGQVPRHQARQRGRRQGREGRGRGQAGAEEHEVRVAQERGGSDGSAAGGQAQPCETTVGDRTGVRDARDPAGHPRRQRQPDGGGGGVQAVALVDDAFPVGTDEGPRQTVPPAPGRHPRLLRPPIHERDPRRARRHHPTRQDPRTRLQEHGLLLHHDLPDLRQTRPQNSHRLTGLTHTKQRKAVFLFTFIYSFQHLTYYLHLPKAQPIKI